MLLYAENGYGYILPSLGVLIACALLSQVGAMFLVLILSAGKILKENKGYSFLCMAVSAFLAISFGESALLRDDNASLISWYGLFYEKEYFNFILMVILLIWLVNGSYRLLRAEFQYKNIPWVWFSFLMFISVYVSGFDGTSNILLPFISLCFFAYLTLFFDNKNFVAYRKIVTNFRSKQWIRALESMPLWIVSLFGLFVIILYTIMAISDDVIQFGEIEHLDSLSLQIFIMSVFVFLLRDVIIFHYFASETSRVKANLLPLLYLGILYIAIPSVFFAMDLKVLAYSFLPAFYIFDKENYVDNLFIIYPVIVHLVIFSALYLKFVKRKKKS